jgi:hypothetical protein
MKIHSKCKASLSIGTPKKKTKKKGNPNQRHPQKPKRGKTTTLVTLTSYVPHKQKNPRSPPINTRTQDDNPNPTHIHFIPSINPLKNQESSLSLIKTLKVHTLAFTTARTITSCIIVYGALQFIFSSLLPFIQRLDVEVKTSCRCSSSRIVKSNSRSLLCHSKNKMAFKIII